MASIYPNRKDGKITSFKFQAFLGKDQNGKQVFKCTTWISTKTATDTKLMAQAKKETAIWERQLIEDYEAQERAFSPSEITFELFINQVWLPYQKNSRENRGSNRRLSRLLEKHLRLRNAMSVFSFLP